MPSPTLLRRGACPGVVDAMQSADGWLMRIRLPGGSIGADQLGAVADVSARFGSGVVEITSRANLQIRGLPDETRDQAAGAMIEAGLAHPDPRLDARRAILAPALAGHDPTEVLDVRAHVIAVERALMALDRALHPKFSVVIDGGGELGVAGMPGDVVIGATPITDPTGPVVGIHRHIDAGRRNVIAAPAFGRLTPDQLRVLAGIAAPIAFTHLRGVAVGGVAEADVGGLVRRLAAHGLSSEPTDPVHGVTACAGRPGCASAGADTLAAAAELVAHRRSSPAPFDPIHLAGCEKLCGAPPGAEHVVLA